MFDLKCKQSNCTFNKMHVCSASEINVDKKTHCKTFEENNLKPKEREQIIQPMIRKNICVNCQADCIFNHQSICNANGISVLTDKENPICCTFLPK
ncbi:MAG: DUF1540 domain-containing protein [Clostridia bacterium]|nr:DUF1540 domain-containing protein [Clostridia bacterium]